MLFLFYRNYKRTSNRKLCTEETLNAARTLIADGYSNRAAAERLGIHESTLRKRLQSGRGAKSFGRFKPVFTEEMERLLVQHCKDMDDRFYGLSLKSLRMIAYEYAILNNIRHPFDEQKKLAGKDWAYKFVQKYGLSLRTPNPTSLARMMGFNKTQIDIFFGNLSKLYKEHIFPPGSVYNMDESGISTVPNKIPKIVSTKGKKLVGKISSAERGETVTLVCAMSAAGNFVAPAFIFPRKRMKNELMDGSPPESIGLCSDSGYINSTLFIEWLKHFQSKVRADKDHPVLLILDNHSSHRSLEAVLYCRENSIHLLTIPPHSSHRLQPLDRSYFKPLKTLYADECDRWLTTNPGRQITHFQIAKILGRAYERCSTMDKGVKAFETCGIYPMNRNVFSDEDFLPSSVTERINIEDQEPFENHEVNHSESDSDPEFSVPLSTLRKKAKMVHLTPEKQSENISLDQLYPPSTSPGAPVKTVHSNKENKSVKIPFASAENISLDQLYPPSTSRGAPVKAVHSTKENKSLKIPFASSENISLDQLYPPSTSRGTSVKIVHSTPEKQTVRNPIAFSAKMVTPIEILPLPRRSEDQKRRKQGQKSEILSSTPFKEKLETVCEEKQKKEELRKKKAVKRNITKDEQQKSDKKEIKKYSDEVACPGCSEKYSNPPIEDWIQCEKCSKWWHEECTAYERNGKFICDCCE